jgi:WD40 repeat protein
MIATAAPISSARSAASSAPSGGHSCFSTARGKEHDSANLRNEEQEKTLPESGNLELEHVIGFKGSHLHTLAAHPVQGKHIFRAVGSILVRSDVNDPHEQRIFWGHDYAISALAVSSDGSLVATGQKGSQQRKGFPATIILWDVEQGRQRYKLEGITQGVLHVAFSPDSAIVSGSGSDGLFYMWDVGTGELLYAQRCAGNISLMLWGQVHLEGRRPQYDLFLSWGAEVMPYRVSFDPVRRQWGLAGEPMGMPSSGIRHRSHNCCVIQRPRQKDAEYLLCGNDVGDMVVFRLSPSNVYRGSVPVCGAGLLSMVIDPQSGAVLCGGGDGIIRKLSGAETVWMVEQEQSFDGGIVSMSLMAGESEALIGTSAGSVYRLLLSDLSKHQKLESSHTSAISTVTTGPRSDIFATSSEQGVTRIWDLSDYTVIAEARPRQKAAGARTSSWIEDGNLIAVGYQDGFVRCFRAETGEEVWSIPNAHRGEVTSLAIHVATDDAPTAYFVSGADDGCVRVWSLHTRELMMQFAEHQKAVVTVLVDVLQDHIVHSIGLDGAIFSYDLRRERRRTAHLIGNGSFTAAAQRLDSEQEIITGDGYGRLHFWDCDVQTPVLSVSDPSHSAITCTSLSPSGAFLAVCGSDTLIKILHIHSSGLKTVACGRGHSQTVRSVAWTRDEKQLISAGDDSSICVWNFYGDEASLK